MATSALRRAKANRRPGSRHLLPSWSVPAAVLGLTTVGFALRAVNITQSLFGDELSTAWIVHGRSFGQVLSWVNSDAEITPPLSFVLAWISLKIGSGWAWLRLPSLLAGTATIPIVYGIGARTSTRRAGLIAAAITAISGMMIMFSVEARSYSVMTAAVAGSTLFMLTALDTGRARWWFLYGLSSCVAMYSHYTAVFVLTIQALWLLWRHPAARRPALLANVGAAVAYAPWIPGAIRDTHSITIPILNALAPFNAGAVRDSVARWAIGYPYLDLHTAPGITFVWLATAGVLIALLGLAVRSLQVVRSGEDRLPGLVSERALLILALAAATVVGELVLGLIGTHVLDWRNLQASWPALAVSLGIVVAAAGPLLGSVACVLVLAGYAAGAADTLQPRYDRPDYRGVAADISRQARPGDEILDESNIPVVPLTGLDAYLPQDHREFRLGLPEGAPPFLPTSRTPPPDVLVKRAIQELGGGKLFVLTGVVPGRLAPFTASLSQRFGPRRLLPLLGRRYEIQSTERFPGLESLALTVLAPRASPGAK